MIIYGVYEKTLYRNEKNGETLFTIIPEDRSSVNDYGNVVCRGIIPRYPERIPLKMLVSASEDDTTYGVWKTEPCAYNQKVVSDFLSSDIFKGVGPKKAEEFAAKYGNIFEVDYSEETEPIFDKIEQIRCFNELYRIIALNNGNFHHAYRVFRRYGIKSVEMINKNPYIMADLVPFKILDSMAKRYGFDTFHSERLIALLKEACRINEAKGNTCISIDDLMVIVKRLDSNICITNIIGVLFENKAFVTKKINDKLFVFTRTIYMAEENTAFNIARLSYNNKTDDVIDEEVIRQIEKQENTEYDEGQKKAFNLLLRSGVKIITGGPGTGKTTVINGLIKYISMKYPFASVVLAAPTANAAKRMREKTGLGASTVHKLLKIQPFGAGDDFDFKNIDDDFVIIDESSFIDIRLASVILQAVKKDARIIFVGDVDQLPSVGPGAFFRDLMDSGNVETVRLANIHRQAGESLIIENAVKIRSGNSELNAGEDFNIVRVENSKQLEETALLYMKKYYDKCEPYKVRLYSPVKKRTYNICTHSFNKSLQEEYSTKDKEFVYGYTRFYIGDPVIFSYNNYKTGYCNGDEGVIIDILEDDRGLLVKVDDNLLEIEGDDLLDIDVAYSITTHKSQGSECETAIVVVPAEPKGMLDRSMIYVAVTRAKKNVIVISEGDSLETAILNDKKSDRITGLKELIRGDSN